jgi:alpha-glucosidase (family GH31 glycosyl hydrolase)
MTEPISRRHALRQLGVAGAGMVFAGALRGAEAAPIIVGGQPVEIQVWTLSPYTSRITVRPIVNTQALGVPYTGALKQDDAGTSVARASDSTRLTRVRSGNLVVRVALNPPRIFIDDAAGANVQTLRLDPVTKHVGFLLGDGPLLGFGEGGAQYDRRGSVDNMNAGQGARSAGPKPFVLDTHGTRAPVQWLISTGSRWGMFIHQPYGAFDLTGSAGSFIPRGNDPQALDVFIVHAQEPQRMMQEYALITGLPEMPPRWSLGYMQSSRTLNGEAEIVGIARKFRERKLPCDALIYLGTEFAPSGWNTRNGETTWHPTNFPNPKAVLDQLHALNFKVIVHIVIEGRTLTGTVNDPCTAPELPPGRTPDNRWPPDRQVACYWPTHKPLMDVGVDGWWPDQGDGFDGPSRLNRHRMYWEGTQQYRPNERPFALHRNASPGIQRYGGFIWSGDPRSRWETLATHVPVGINSGLSGFPYWGSDIGGFNPTTEYTGELHVRWFQFGAFCASFRAHGRNWHLKLPWGWGESEGGPFEAGQWRADPAELNNPRIEPIIKRYLELRYRLLPYTYTAVREAHDTGMPLMRALWLHDPADPIAAARGDEYLWGPDLLVAPVVEKGAMSRELYLPRGTWHDFWTEERIAGGREIVRSVDLETMPLYVRAGAVLPVGPIKQYADEQVNEPLTLLVFPGANGTSTLYDDDGISFDHRNGGFYRLEMEWTDNTRTLTLRLDPASRMRPPANMQARVAGTPRIVPINFTGTSIQVRL